MSFINFKRKKILLDKRLQLKFVFFIVSAFIINTFLFLSLFVLYFRSFEEKVSVLYNPTVDEYLTMLKSHQSDVTSILVYTSIITVLFVGFMSLGFSHKIVGPIFKIKKELKKMKDGEEINPIKLRDDDYFKDLAEDINNLLIKK
jgi:uncharacterized protein involved in cysteine biosynthesis